MPEATQSRSRVVLRRVITVLAGVLVYCALTAPREIDQLTPAAFVRIPVEGLAAVAVLLAAARAAPPGGRGGRWRTARPPHDHQDDRHGLPVDARAPVRPGAGLDARRRRLQLRARVVRQRGRGGRLGARRACSWCVRAGAHDARGACGSPGSWTGGGGPRPRPWRCSRWCGWARRCSAPSSWTRCRSPPAAWPRSSTRTPPRSRSACGPGRVRGAGLRRRVPRHPERPAAHRAAGQGRGARRSSRATAARRWRTRATPRWWTPRWTRARQELKSAGFAATQRLPHLAGGGRRQLARARDVRLGPVDRQPAARPQPRLERPPHLEQRVQEGAAGTRWR